MSDQPHPAVGVLEPTPAAVAGLLDMVAAHGVDHVLSELEQVIARMRAGAAEAAEARAALRDVPAPVLRAAVQLRSARNESTRIGTAR